ncbi:hypothetical protein ANO11243_081710 [Dothideomycetidae sp. 11243]|nr:hypothetical protein ANO11243_081710 [fungal sp. No.11243]
MTSIDPSTGRPLPPTAIQRALFVGQKVHVYAIPPLTSTRGFQAGPWTAPPNPTAKQIFTARLRVLETSIEGRISCAVALEDVSSGELFAAAPYAAASVVQAATDSSRFFAILVTGEGGRRATLGIGFEDRGEAVDFGIALAEARKVLGVDGQAGQQPGRPNVPPKTDAVKRDFGLKEGESIVIEIGGKGRRVRDKGEDKDLNNKALFSIAPPPAAGATAAPPQLAPLAPPPSASASRTDTKKQAQDLGFDDGEFGEFQ